MEHSTFGDNEVEVRNISSQSRGTYNKTCHFSCHNHNVYRGSIVLVPPALLLLFLFLASLVLFFRADHTHICNI
jgi:hypothetical protein